MQWHRNCRSVIKAVRPARLGNWKMDHSTSGEVICTYCQVQIDGRAIAISATEDMCSDCWHPIPSRTANQSFLRQLFREAASILYSHDRPHSPSSPTSRRTRAPGA